MVHRPDNNKHEKTEITPLNRPKGKEGVRSLIVIPAYQPNQVLVNLIQSLVTQKNVDILVIDDGSSDSSRDYFLKIERIPQVVLLRHQINQGKGQALKTAIEYFLLSCPDNCVGIVTADADGQHAVADILNMVKQQIKHPHNLVIGIRTFDKTVPYRSRFGNQLTCYLFKFFFGKMLMDTQSGLRAIPRNFLPELLTIPSRGYEFELEMLIKAIRQNIQIKEIPINTIYQDKNKHSHFNPLIDSLKIYFIFIRFLANSILSALIDYIVFALFIFQTQNMLLSLCMARLVASSLNFSFSRSLVFKSKNKVISQGSKYILLLVFLMVTSYGCMSFLVTVLGMNVFISKIIHP